MTDVSSWLSAEPCVNAFHSLASSLHEATTLRPEDEDISSSTTSGYKIALKCGHAKFQENKASWTLRHRAMTYVSSEQSNFDSLAFTGKRGANYDPSKPLLCPSAKWICRLAYKDIGESGYVAPGECPLFPPLAFVQLIFRAVELVSILEHARVEYRRNWFQKMQCRSRVSRQPIDIEPIFATFWKMHAADKLRNRIVDKLLTVTIESISEICHQMMEPWTKLWDIEIDLPHRSSDLKPYLQASLATIRSFVRACLVGPKPMVERVNNVLDTSEHERSTIETNSNPASAMSALDAREINSTRYDSGTIEITNSPASTLSALDATEINSARYDNGTIATTSSPVSTLSALDATEINGARYDSGNIETTSSSTSAMSALHVREMIIGSYDSNDVTKDLYELKKCPQQPKTISIPVDNESKSPTQSRVLPMLADEFEEVSQSPETSSAEKKGDVSHQFDRDIQNTSTCTKSVTGVVVVESTDVDFRGRKTKSTRPERKLDESLDARIQREHHGSKNLSSENLFESRESDDGDRRKPLNIIVDEDSCASRNKDEMSSDTTEKSVSAIDPKEEATHQEVRVLSTTTDDCGETKSLETSIVAHESEQSSSRAMGSASDQYTDLEFCSENFNEELNTPWVKLSHIGHISDYHGYQRQHQSFTPLKYSASALETCGYLEKTLREAKSASSRIIHDDVDSDEDNYDHVLSSYFTLQSCKRKCKSESPLQHQIMGKEISFDGDINTLPLCFTPSTSIDKNPKKRKYESLDRNTLIPTPKCQAVGVDPIMFWKDNQNTVKRPRRTAELNELKKISIMMLSEMYHTLRFIEDYNGGILNIPDTSHTEDVATFEADLGSTRDQQSGISSHVESSENGIKARKFLDPYVKVLAKAVDKLPLEAMFMKNNYRDIQQQFISLRDLPEAPKFDALRACIETAMKKERSSIYTDEEIGKEEKSRKRIARGYKRKADQEKIEKKHHEDERLLLLRQFEYTNRNKKLSAVEIEMEKFEIRPIQIVDQAGKESYTERCQLGTTCSLCKPYVLTDSSASGNAGESNSARIIHSPMYRQIDLDAVAQEDLCKEPLLDSDKGDSSLRSLMEMRHILTFIEKYRKGIIQ